MGAAAIYLARRVDYFRPEEVKAFRPEEVDALKEAALRMTLPEVVEEVGLKNMREYKIFPRRFLQNKPKEFCPNYEKISAIRFEGTKEEVSLWEELCGEVLALETKRMEAESKIDQNYPNRQEKLMAHWDEKIKKKQKDTTLPEHQKLAEVLSLIRIRGQIDGKREGSLEQREYDYDMQKEEIAYDEALSKLEKRFSALFGKPIK